MTAPQRKAGRAWRTLRDSMLKGNPYCAIRGPRCTVVATTVDHIVPVTMGGAELDPANCRPACARCHYGGGARITNARRAGQVPSAAAAERARRWAAADKRRREAAWTWESTHRPCDSACNGSPVPPGCLRTSELNWY